MYEPMEVVQFGSLTDALRQELEGDEQDPFQSRGIAVEFRPKDRHVGLIDDQGRLAAAAGLVLVEVEVAHQRFPVAGLGGVIVNASHRGAGLGRRVVEAALREAVDLGPAFALLFCHADRMGFYRKLSFAEVTAEIVVQQPRGFRRIPQRTMWRGLREHVEWPSGRVTLHSLPF